MYAKGEVVLPFILATTIGLFFLQLFFLSLGLVLSALYKNPKVPPALASGWLIFLFFLYKLSDMHLSLNFLKYGTPFAYFDASQIMTWGLNLYAMILFGLLIVLMVIITFARYQKKDLLI